MYDVELSANVDLLPVSLVLPGQRLPDGVYNSVPCVLLRKTKAKVTRMYIHTHSLALVPTLTDYDLHTYLGENLASTSSSVTLLPDHQKEKLPQEFIN